MGGEGIFAVEAWVRDRVGNESLAQSEMVVIDASDPTIEITGAEDGSANASTLHIQARCLDASFLPGSMKAEMKADFGGIIPAASLREESGGGALLTFGDFPRRREADEECQHYGHVSSHTPSEFQSLMSPSTIFLPVNQAAQDWGSMA